MPRPMFAAICGFLWIAIAPCAMRADGFAWNKYAKKPDAWFTSAEGRQVTENVLSHQSPLGSWPKNLDTAAASYQGDPKDLHGTFDNGATCGETRLLARAFQATGDARCQAAVFRAIDHVFQAQYPSGGWPQFYPPSKKYHRYITFNDNAMVNLMEFLREVAGGDRFALVDAPRRKEAQAAFDRGIACILKCQVVVKGRPTAWCAQHDPATLEPRPARAYELVSLSGAESAGIVRLLMSLDQPRPEVVRAIDAACTWFEEVKLTGIRQTVVDGDKRIVRDLEAPPLWARFYEIGTNRPMFCGRDGVVKYNLAQIEHERRNGYAWYGNWGTPLLAQWAKWRKGR